MREDAMVGEAAAECPGAGVGAGGLPPLPEEAGGGARFGERRPPVFVVALVAVCVAVAMAAPTLDPAGLGVAAPPQGDVYIFYQYARAWVAGHPYRFQAGDAPTTGSTSHLYPMLLAPIVAAGQAIGPNAMAVGGALLGVVLFVGAMLLVRELLEETCPAAPRMGWLLVALSGQTAYTMTSQMEMGPFVVLALGAWVAWMRGRMGVVVGLVALAPWMRPEGFVLGVAIGVVEAAGAIAGGGVGGGGAGGERGVAVRFAACRRGVAVAGAAVGSLAAVLAWNAAWTGRVGFDSTAGKGLLAGGFDLEVATSALRDVVELAAAVGFGVGDGLRPFLLLPVVGGILAVAGIADAWNDPRPASPARRLAAAWGLCAAALVCLSATSGWSGLHHDRYLAWLLPCWLMFAAQGAGVVGRRLGAAWGRVSGPRASGPRALLAMGAVLVAWQAWGWGQFAVAFRAEATATARHADFLRELNERLPEGARVADVGASGLIAWHLTRVHVTNLHGVTSPEFATVAARRDRAERLRRDPALRFDYFLIYEGLEERDPWVAPLLGRVVAVDPRAREGERRFRLIAPNLTALRDEAPRPPAAGEGSTPP